MTETSHGVTLLGAGLMDPLCCGTLPRQGPEQPSEGVLLMLLSICFSETAFAYDFVTSSSLF